VNNRKLIEGMSETGFATDVLERVLARVKMRPVNPDGPDCDVLESLPLVEVPQSANWCNDMGADTPISYFRLGECTVIRTHNHGKTWHLSIAHHERNPTWHEISQARYCLLPPHIWVAMYLPPKADYVNLHRNCFQMMECQPPAEDVQ
jgi:hypothetical protein